MQMLKAKHISTKTKKSILVGTIYWHPNAKINTFIEQYSYCLEELANEQTHLYILGDININVYDTNQSSHATNYINATECNRAFHLITKPTRVTNSSATAIDHTTTNDAMHTIHPSITKSNLTDHYLIMHKITFETIKNKKRKAFLQQQKIVQSQIIP